MSLKIIGRWKHWGKSMSRHWNAIHKDLHETHPVVEPNIDGGSLKRKRTKSDTVAALDDSDNEDEHQVPNHSDQLTEWEAFIARRVSRRWRKLAGVAQEAPCVEPMEDGEFQADWTRVSLECVEAVR
jgi:5'-nucleotidase